MRTGHATLIHPVAGATSCSASDSAKAETAERPIIRGPVTCPGTFQATNMPTSPKPRNAKLHSSPPTTKLTTVTATADKPTNGQTALLIISRFIQLSWTLATEALRNPFLQTIRSKDPVTRSRLTCLGIRSVSSRLLCRPPGRIWGLLTRMADSEPTHPAQVLLPKRPASLQIGISAARSPCARTGDVAYR